MIDERFYLFGSRMATHVVFWIGYFVLFGYVWAKSDSGYLASYFLEFVLLPARILAVYAMLYVLMPQFLLARRFKLFFIFYLGLLILASVLQRLSGYFFYDQLFPDNAHELFSLAALGRSILLINTTVLFVASFKLLQLYLAKSDELDCIKLTTSTQIEIKSNRRIHLIQPSNILYIEGMGNYITYHLQNGQKLIEYASIKSTLARLPKSFIRLHKSYIVNLCHIKSFGPEDIEVGSQTLPRGKQISDDVLTSFS